MPRTNPIFLALLFCLFPLGAPAIAQSNAAGSSAPAPSDQTAEAPSQSAAVAPAQPTTKKVWTNEDMSDVAGASAGAGHPVPSAKPSAAKTPVPKVATGTKGKSAKWYDDQIVKLQAQLPALEEQISQLQAALSGQSVDAVRRYGWLRPDDWTVQLAQLQQKRDDIFAKIAALEDDARHSGVPANALP